MSPKSLLLPLLALIVAGPVAVAADAHAGHDHGHSHDHGALTSLGSLGIGQGKIALAAAGKPQAGKVWHVQVTSEPASAAPKSIRLWVGVENGRGSVKAKAAPEKVAGKFSAHVEVPAPLPAEAKLWLSVETASGETVKTSVALTGG